MTHPAVRPRQGRAGVAALGRQAEPVPLVPGPGAIQCRGAASRVRVARRRRSPHTPVHVGRRGPRHCKEGAATRTAPPSDGRWRRPRAPWIPLGLGNLGPARFRDWPGAPRPRPPASVRVSRPPQAARPRPGPGRRGPGRSLSDLVETATRGVARPPGAGFDPQACEFRARPGPSARATGL